MNILLFGRDNSITHTIHDMLNSGNGWQTTLFFELAPLLKLDDGIDDKTPSYNILIANLSGFSQSPTSLITQISAVLPTIPLLVMYSYSKEVLVKPLIKAGTNGYLQLGSSEVKLLETVKKVAEGEEVILTEIT